MGIAEPFKLRAGEEDEMILEEEKQYRAALGDSSSAFKIVISQDYEYIIRSLLCCSSRLKAKLAHLKFAYLKAFHDS